MQLSKQDKKYKAYLSLQKRLDNLRDLIKKQPLIKLEKPYQNGWIISYVVSEQFNALSIEKEKLQELIDANYTIRYTKDVGVIRAIRKGAKMFRRKKKISRITDFLPGSFYVRKEKISIEYKDYYIMKLDSWSNKEYYKLKLPSHFLTVRIKPNLITHTRGKNGDLESEMAILHEKLYHSHDFESFAINYNKSYPKHKDRRIVRDNINKFKNGAADDIYLEKIPLHYKY